MTAASCAAMRWRWRSRSPARRCSAGFGIVEIGKSLYLQPSFSAPLIFAGGLAVRASAWCWRTAAPRARWCCSARAICARWWCSVIIGVAAQMTLKGLLAPARLAFLQWTASDAGRTSRCRHCSARSGSARARADRRDADRQRRAAARSHSRIARFRRSYGQIAAGLVIGLLVVAGWLTTGWLGADDFNPIPVTSLTFVSPIADTLQYAMLSTGLSLNFGIALVARRAGRQRRHRAAERPLRARRLHLGAAHAAVDRSARR